MENHKPAEPCRHELKGVHRQQSGRKTGESSTEMEDMPALKEGLRFLLADRP